MTGLTEHELRALHCWEAVDRVSGDAAMTAFKQQLRMHQARWRDASGHPCGTHPIKGGDAARPLGSRLELEHAMRTGANFLNDNARAAAAHRLANPEKHQTLNPQRLWADLLSSMPMCFNLFGDLHADLAAADRIAHRWWPDLPGRVTEVRFEWSPGRLDTAYLGNRTAFDATIVVDLPEGDRGVVGVETKYHEHAILEKRPGPERLPRYLQVSERSGVFEAGALDQIVGTRLQQIWLDHLLVLAMLQHPVARWTWGRFVLIHPAGNSSFSGLAEEYRQLLVDGEAFEHRTLEELLDTADALPAPTVAAFRGRYLP